jgi:hypothetical protein
MPRWLDRFLPDVTIEPPHDGQRRLPVVEQPSSAPSQP